jgi:hypothetical protein
MKDTICDEAAVDAKLCAQEDVGSFILTKNATDASQSPIISKAIHLNNPDAIKYPVKKTGFYCVSTYAYSGEDYNAVVTFRNSYGELPAAQIAKLPFYGALTIVYAVVGMYVDIGLAIVQKGNADMFLGSGHSYMSKIAMIFVSQESVR